MHVTARSARTTLCLGLLAALPKFACAGSAPSSSASHQGPPAKEGEAATSLAALAFRLAHSNPGGMWRPEQLNLPRHAEALRSMGVALDPAMLANPLTAPLAAVVSLGGCSASFVSGEGLVVTNHHCIQGALQHNSSEGENLVEDGFLALTRADERHAGPAQRIFVARAFTDVTDEVRTGIEEIADAAERKRVVDERVKTIVAKCEHGRPEIRCDLRAYDRGALHLLVENLEIRDVRLVYAPRRSIGNYGGETDNWSWPRHTGDFAFYRAYVGPDGAPAEHAAENVPFKPPHFLRVSKGGVAAGDFVMIAGYPGTTSRNESALETRNAVDWLYPYLIGYFRQRYEIATMLLEAAGSTAIKASVQKQGAQNGLEKFEGILKGLTSNPELMARKETLDQAVREWATQPGNEPHRARLERLEEVLRTAQATQGPDFDRNLAFGTSRLLASALSFARWAEERPKKDAARRLGFQDRDLPLAIDGQRSLSRAYDRQLDRANLRLALVRALERPEAERPWLRTLLGLSKKQPLDASTIDRVLDGWYRNPRLEDEATRLRLLTRGTPAECKRLRDPIMQAALRVFPIHKAEEKKADARAGELLLSIPSYIEGIKQIRGDEFASDANGTLRITYGTVRSFTPTSTAEADWPFTTARQIVAKNTGEPPFDAPAELLEAIEGRRYGRYAEPKLGGELPVNFLSDLDITGGNSGSATIDHHGELVGLAFDGTTEGLASDVVFHPATTRVIHVDARYMRFIMEHIDGAGHLLEEMGLPVDH